MSMVTKDRERKALAKIREIIESCGNDSYIGIAFEGCVEDAEQNIEMDWGCSMKDRVDGLDQENAKLQSKVKELEKKLAESDKDYEAAHAAAHLVAEEKDSEISKLKARIQELLEDARKGGEYITELNNRMREHEDRADAAEEEIIRLKAKLYDYMTAGEQ